MKKILLAALFWTSLSAHPLLEVKAGYFLFLDPKMSDIYTTGGPDVQLSVSVPLREALHLYASGEWLERTGKSLNADQSTTFWALPVSVGLRPMILISEHIDFYLTLGPRYFFAYVDTSSSFVDKHISANGLGGFANSGLLFYLKRHFVLDLFVEYSYAKLSFKPSGTGVFGETAQVGGLSFGGGFAYRF